MREVRPASAGDRDPRGLLHRAGEARGDVPARRAGHPLRSRDGDALADLWSRLSAGTTDGDGNPSPMPDPWREVDFGRETVLAVGLGGRATTGYSGDVVRLAAREDGAPALRRETRPGRDCVVGRLVTQPRVAVRVARVDGEVSFQGSAVEQPCGGEVRGPAR